MESLITEDDLNELDRIVTDFEEKYKKFSADTNTESDFQTILRAHLYIEYELERMLLGNVNNPEVIRGKLRFVDKVRIIFALGLLPMGDMIAINKINFYRNSYAHELDYIFTEEDYNKLIDSFSPQQRKQYQGYINKNNIANVSEKLKIALFTIWILLYEANTISKDMRKKLEDYLRNFPRRSPSNSVKAYDI
ncbi:hypothetical protein [Paenibacillus chitinolyticus]|uniref:hypothetical protein n=1 Tax=Paenibacillus chitinolyticus TaxID=79263 RepID=UPI00366CA1C0